MTETPTERAARAHYVRECAKRYGATPERANEDWSDPDMGPWRAQKIASMAAALAEYEAAKAEASAEKRERAISEIKEIIADGCVCDRHCTELTGADVYCGCEKDARDTITAYERVMAEPEHSLREKACEDLDRMLANGCDPATAVEIFVEEMAEANASQPRKEGA